MEIKNQNLPVLARVLTFLLIIDGIFNILGSFLVILGNVVAGGLVLLIGVSKIVFATGLRKMKKWGLYGFTLIGIASIVLFVTGAKDIVAILSVCLNVIILAYFWFILFKKLN